MVVAVVGCMHCTVSYLSPCVNALCLWSQGFYTAFAVTNIYIIEGGGSNLYEPPSLYYSFSASEIAARVRGSKIEFASENVCLLPHSRSAKPNTMFETVPALHHLFSQGLHALGTLPTDVGAFSESTLSNC